MENKGKLNVTNCFIYSRYCFCYFNWSNIIVSLISRKII